MPARDERSEAIRSFTESVGVRRLDDPVTPEQASTYGALKEIDERVKHHRTIVHAWKTQQDQDRAMRKRYATWLMIVLSTQIVAINAIFVLIGSKVLTFEPWTANTFVMAVFAEIGALVLLVVKYLFPAPSDKILELIGLFRAKDRAE